MTLKRLSIVVDANLWSIKHIDQVNCLEQALLNASGWPRDYPIIWSDLLESDGAIRTAMTKEDP